LRGVSLAGIASFLLSSSASLPVAAEEVIEIGVAAKSRVPRWDAKGFGRLPCQGIACLDLSEDGRFVAAGTVAPPGHPNLFILDDAGNIFGQYHAGMRWINEVTVSDDGRFVAGLCTTPEGTSGDTPRLYGFHRGKESTQISGDFRLRDFRPGQFLFHYGDHSNHLPPVSRWADNHWVIADDDLVRWLSLSNSPVLQQAHLGQGVTTAFAAGAGGLVVVGRFDRADPSSHEFRNLLVLRPDGQKPMVWSRPVSMDVASSSKPEQGVYGPPVPPYRDVRFQAPLAVAIDAAGKQIAVADYEGWQRILRPRDGGAEWPYGTRFMPSRPTIHVYDAKGNTICHVGPEVFSQPFWCDVVFFADGRKLLISPHNWASRGLAGQPFLPANENVRTFYVLDIPRGDLQAVRLPDAISSVDAGGADRTVVGCWDHKVYLLDRGYRPIRGLPDGLDVGAASLVRISKDGKRVAVATSAGIVRMLDTDGRQLWQTDLAGAAQPGEELWTKNQRPGRMAPGIWRTNGGLAHSDMGSQFLVEAPQGLILIDPNAGASFQQNWAKIQGAGLDPMQVKYVLLTHEHGDHAPGAYLWRVATGAQVVAGVETAYMLRHHIPAATGYGFHPPVPVDIVLTEDKELDLAGLKVKAMRLQGHTFGSMGYAFEQQGKAYVAIGDLIMPGGVLGYSGSLDFRAENVLGSLKKLALLNPDVVLGGHGSGDPDDFIAAGIEAGEATGWSKMAPPKPDPLYRFTQKNYLVAAWLEKILSAAYGDVDGDGRADVAVLVPQGRGSAVKIYLNHGHEFAAVPSATVTLPKLGHGWKLRMLRLGDGKAADLFVASQRQAILLLARGARLDFKAVPLQVTRGSQVAAGHFDGDGRKDLVIGSRFVSGYYLASQQERGTFHVRQTAAPSKSYFDIELADVNGDRREDLLTSSGDVFPRQPDGSLAETPAFQLKPPTGEPPGWAFMAAADFDHDSWTDVALLANGPRGAVVWVYRNTGNAREPLSEQPSAEFIIADAIVSRDGPTVADFDGDGVPDLLLGSSDRRPAVHILSGSPADGLSPNRVACITLDYVPHHDARFGVFDFNADGRPDLAGFGRSPTGAVGVYIWLQPGT